MTSITVEGGVLNGNIRVTEQTRLQEWKQRLEPGTRLAITFELFEDARTRRQQRLLHELLGRYARALNQSLEHVKMEFKLDLGHWVPWEKIASGELKLPTWRGAPVDLHAHKPEYYPTRTIAYVRSEADYTKQMEGEFIDTVISACADNDVYVGDILATLDLEGRH